MTIITRKPPSSGLRTVPRTCCEDDCRSRARNRYFLGKRLTPDSYELEQSYFIERRWLLNRAIHGWGVVYGFALTADAGVLRIGEGLALDEAGRELVQVGPIDLSLDNLVILDASGKPIVPASGDLNDRIGSTQGDPNCCWRLTAHYAEKQIDPVLLRGDCDCKRKEWDRTCETIVYALSRIDCAQCCDPQPCGLECACCAAGPCCEGQAAQLQEIIDKESALKADYDARITEQFGNDPAIAQIQVEFDKRFDDLMAARLAVEKATHARGGCDCLCHHLTRLPVGVSCARLTDAGDCTEADFGNGIALACLSLEQDACEKWHIAAVTDACGPRRLVKRNDLLFDLINGCDVTRIVEIGWAKWHRRHVPPVPFKQFAQALGWDETQPECAEYPTVDFWVTFSRPVRADTVGPECFVMTVTSDQAEGCWRDVYRVPIVAVDTDWLTPEAGDPPGHVRGARIVVSGAWLRDGVLGDGSIFREGETGVEIEIRGDFIVDCLGQTVDANPRGRMPMPTGSDGPGDAYISTFTVAERFPSSGGQPGPSQPKRPTQQNKGTAS